MKSKPYFCYRRNRTYVWHRMGLHAAMWTDDSRWSIASQTLGSWYVCKLQLNPCICFSSSQSNTKTKHNVCVFLEWRWVRGQQPREEYLNILNAFIDKKDSYYSIHQIGKSQSCVVNISSVLYTSQMYCLRTLQLVAFFTFSSDGSGRGQVHRPVVWPKYSGTGTQVSRITYVCHPEWREKIIVNSFSFETHTYVCIGR